MKHFSLIAGLCFFYSAAISQTDESTPHAFWFGVGGGTYRPISNQINENSLSILLSGTLMKNNRFYKIRYLRNYEVAFFNSLNPSEYYNCFAFLPGIGISDKFFRLEASAGLGITTGRIRGDFLNNNGAWIFSQDIYEEKKFLAISFPVEVEMMFVPIRYAGLGVAIFADLNLVRPTYGIVGTLSLGKLK